MSRDILPIIARTVCATGHKSITHTVYLTPGEEVDIVLGARMTDVKVNGESDGSQVVARVEFVVHAWYTFEGGRQSGIATEHVLHEEEIPVTQLPGVERLGGAEETYVSVTKQPRVVDQFIRSSETLAIGVTVTIGLSVNIVGESKVWVRIYPPSVELGERAPESIGDDTETFEFLDKEDDIDLPQSSPDPDTSGE